MHHDPGALPSLREEDLGPNRFDDPRAVTADRYVIRYAATTLRGCLLELLDWLRPSEEAATREAAVSDEHPLQPEAATDERGQALADYLTARRVGRLTAATPAVVSVNDPVVQAQLDREPAVRALLDSPRGRDALLPYGSPPTRNVHLDEAAVRLSTELGRDITRACSLALRDRPNRPDVIHYRSRHDDQEDCWAIYDHAAVIVDQVHPLSPADTGHRQAVHAVAAQWELPLPDGWA